MNCSAEQVALYVGGDLTTAEESDLQLHLATCAACQRLLTDLQADATQLQSMAPDLSTMAPDRSAMAPRRSPKRAPLRWLPAASIALVLLSLVAVPTVKAISDLIHQITPTLSVREMTPESYEAWLAEHPAPEDQPLERPLVWVGSVEEAEATAGYQVARVGYLPSTLTPWRVAIQKPRNPAIHHMVQQYFNLEGSRTPLVLHQSGPVTQAEYLSHSSTTNRVTVNGESAAIISTAYEFEGRSHTDRQLIFQWQEHLMELHILMPTAELALLPDAELVQIAESLY